MTITTPTMLERLERAVFYDRGFDCTSQEALQMLDEITSMQRTIYGLRDMLSESAKLLRQERQRA